MSVGLWFVLVACVCFVANINDQCQVQFQGGRGVVLTCGVEIVNVRRERLNSTASAALGGWHEKRLP